MVPDESELLMALRLANVALHRCSEARSVQ
jgi:hypothetical protein